MEPDFVEECLSVLTRTPATLDALLGDLPDAWTAATEGPGTWSPCVVIGHLIHAEKADWIPRLHHPDHLTQYPQEFSMSKTAITSPELAPPVGPFSQAIEVGGFIYFSGQVGQDPATGKVVEGGIAAETERVFQNLSAVLKAAGKSFDDVVRAGVYLTSMSDFVAMNGIYAKHFSQPFPARTTIAVAALPLGACVEIDLVVKA
jgi:2-iminobutanoate/2-iminopropanoate deaminase